MSNQYLQPNDLKKTKTWVWGTHIGGGGGGGGGGGVLVSSRGWYVVHVTHVFKFKLFFTII
jgi:hypothetical protein